LFLVFATATALKLAFVVIGLWALFTGVMQLMEVPRVRETASESLVVASGAVRVILGVILLARPHAPLRAAIWLVAIYAFVEGFLMLSMGVTGKPRPARPQPA